MSGHCRLESFEGLVNGTESHQHDKGNLWTLDKALHGLPLVCIEKEAVQCYFISHGSRRVLLSCRFIYQSLWWPCWSFIHYTGVINCKTWIMLTCLELLWQVKYAWKSYKIPLWEAMEPTTQQLFARCRKELAYFEQHARRPCWMGVLHQLPFTYLEFSSQQRTIQ